jgi:hypothetical protein
MHAYAADDPVFVAMNRRGQRETGGALGDFCVQCHAPMAVREAATYDGLNLDELGKELKGVTCFFCHTTDAVLGDHNNPLHLSADLALRGALADGIENSAHEQRYSALHDRSRPESARLCGACHDVVTEAGVRLERTFAEWQASFFAREHEHGGLACGNCHMPGTAAAIANVSGTPVRTYHEHAFPGLDVAVTEWPQKEAQLAAIARDLEPAILTRLCFNPSSGGKIQVTLDNIGAGHALPSGAAQDRRMWVELKVERGGTTVLSSGVLAPGKSPSELAATDSLLWQLRDFARRDDDSEAHMFWEVASVENSLLTPLVTTDPSDPRFVHATTREYPLVGGRPERIEMVVHVQPIGLDLIDDLIATGDLDAKVRTVAPTFTIKSSHLVWTPETAGADLCVARSR